MIKLGHCKINTTPTLDIQRHNILTTASAKTLYKDLFLPFSIIFEIIRNTEPTENDKQMTTQLLQDQ